MQWAPLKKKSSMKHLLLAAQIINYQAWEIIASQRVFNVLSERRNTIKRWRRKAVYHCLKFFIMYLQTQLFQWVWKTWERKRSRQWKNPQMTSFHQFSRPDQTWKVAWWKVFWGKWEWECLQRFYISAYFFFVFWGKCEKGCFVIGTSWHNH